MLAKSVISILLLLCSTVVATVDLASLQQEFIKLDRSGATCQMLQQLHYKSAEKAFSISYNVTSPYTEVLKFMRAKPQLRITSSDNVAVSVSSDTCISPENPTAVVDTLRCKLKSLQQLNQDLSLDFTSEFSTCQSMNKAIHQNVLSKLPTDLRDSYVNSGKTLLFEEDIVKSIGPTWVFSKTYFSKDYGTGRVTVKSPRLYSGPGTSRISGMLYCTPISLSKALQLIMSQ